MTDALSLLIVHQNSELYGSDRMVLKLLQAIDSHDTVRTTLHLPFPGPLADAVQPYTDTVLISPLSVLRLQYLKTLKWLNLRAFVTNLKTSWDVLQKHDMVIVNSCVILTYLVLLPFYRKRKFIYVHEINTGLLKLFFNVMLSLTGAELICNSQATLRNYPLVLRKHLLYNATDLKPTPAPKQDFPPFHILCIGRISQRKGQHVLLQAVNLLPADIRSAVHVRIVGDSFNRASTVLRELQDYVLLHNLDSTVSFHPFTADPSEHYEWAHCVVVPSVKPESFGLVALEGMNYACAVIASDIGALAEVIKAGQSGLLVPPDDSRMLAKAIRSYVRYPAVVKQHGQNGYNRAQTNFSYDSYRASVERLITVPMVKTSWLTRILAICGKTYQPDPDLPRRFVLKTILRRLIWLIRGGIRLQKPVFIGPQVTIDGAYNLQLGRMSTFDPNVWVNAIAQEPVVIGQSVRIGAYSRILCTAHLSKVGRGFTMGNHSGCGEFCVFGAAGGITIGERVMIGQYVSMHAQDHVYADIEQPIQHQGTTEQGISIGDDCWIGAKATILDGTAIGKHCVVAAGSVVKGTFPDYTVIAGVPAKIIKQLNTHDT